MTRLQDVLKDKPLPDSLCPQFLYEYALSLHKRLEQLKKLRKKIMQLHEEIKQEEENNEKNKKEPE